MTDTVSWRPEFIADDSGKWVPNGMRFATKEEAEIHAKDTERRWMLVRQTRVVPSPDPVNYRIVKGDVHFRLEAVT
jgi:hypothetical protein